jgi:hypothetical protein
LDLSVAFIPHRLSMAERTGGIEARSRARVGIGDAAAMDGVCTHVLPEKAARPPEASA